MQFENEPKGWDDHIIQNPPDIDLKEMRDRETRRDRSSGRIAVYLLIAGWSVMCWAAAYFITKAILG